MCKTVVNQYPDMLNYTQNWDNDKSERAWFKKFMGEAV
jgi:hypothetical protein